jgi:hypothetical protein
MNDAAGRAGVAADKLAAEIISAHFSEGRYLRGHVEELAGRALYGDEDKLPAANSAIFTILAETLADSFDPRAVTLYNSIFSQLIHYCRARDWELDSRLESFGLRSEEELSGRAEEIRRVGTVAACGLDVPPDRVECAAVLSRVTVGADVAITSVIIERLKRECPSAEILVVGGSKAGELFGGDPRIRVCDIHYGKSGSLISRLLTWSRMIGRIESDLQRAAAGRMILVDPDTRLTQLGLLPVTRRGSLFFPSREYLAASGKPLSVLTSDWMNEVFGGEATTPPALSLLKSDARIGGELVRRLRKSRGKPVVSVNLGVGENDSKCAGPEFEQVFLKGLLELDATVILDRGVGEDEERRTSALINQARTDLKLTVIDVDERSLQTTLRSESVEANLVAWRGRIGLLAALVSESDLYAGYDSAGQHIAAAAGVPCIDVFRGYSSSRMLERWRPSGRGQVFLIDAGAASRPGDLATEALEKARQVLNAADSLRAS